MEKVIIIKYGALNTRRPKGLRVLSGDGIWRRGRNPSPNAQIMILTVFFEFLN